MQEDVQDDVGSEEAWLRRGMGKGGPGGRLGEKVPGVGNRETDGAESSRPTRENFPDCAPQSTKTTRGSSGKACGVRQALRIPHTPCLEFVAPVSIKTGRLAEVLSGAWFSHPPASATARPSLRATPVGIPQSFASTGANLALWFKLRALSLQCAGFLTRGPARDCSANTH